MAPTPALTAPAAPLPEATADRVPERPASGAPNSGIDHLLSLYVQTPATLTGNLFGMLIIAFVFWGLAEPLRLLGWLGVVTALWLVRLAHYLRFRRQRSTENHVLRLWRRSWPRRSRAGRGSAAGRCR